MLRYLIALLFSLGTFSLHAEPVVAPDVVSVDALGYWEVDGRSGFYRVIVVNEGWEHVWSRLFIEWIAIPETPEDAFSIIAQVEPELPVGRGGHVLDAKMIESGVPGRASIVIRASANQEPFESSHFQIEASQPGIWALSEAEPISSNVHFENL